MEKLKHFNLPQHTNMLYQKEAISSIALARDVAKKINELIDAYNELYGVDLEWKQTVQGEVDKGILYMKDNLNNTINDLLSALYNGGDLQSMIDAIYTSQVTENTTLLSLLKMFAIPQMYGAKGDGVTDDTYAIQRALEEAEREDHHTVYFPKGKYRISGNGSIFHSKFVNLIGCDATLYVSNGDANTDIFTFTGTTLNFNGKITGLSFDYAQPYQMINNVFKFVFEKDGDILYNLEISKNVFGKNKGYKIYTEGWSNGGFNNCKFNDNIVYGLFIKSLSYGDSNKINGNSLYGSEEIQLSDYVINLTQTSGSSGCEVNSNNCTSGLGIFNNFHNLTISANQIENTSQINLDYLIKLIGGSCVTIDNNNLNANYNGGLIYSNIVNCVIKNCSWYAVKKGCYALNNNKAHITYIKNVRYFDGETIGYELPEKVVNGYATNVFYNNNNCEMYIDDSLNLHIKPKVTGSFGIAPLNVRTNANELFIPVEVVNGKMLTIKVTNKNYLRTETLLNSYACLPLTYF